MRKILLIVLFVGLAMNLYAADVSTYFGSDKAFSIQAPSSWTQNEYPGYLSISSPDDSVSISGGVWQKKGPLKEFFLFRLKAVQDFYKPAGEKVQIDNGSLTAFYQEFEGVWPGETQATFYVVSCIELKDIFISLNFVTTRENFKKNKSLIHQIITSAAGGT
jgi:hypothetical protein